VKILKQRGGSDDGQWLVSESWSTKLNERLPIIEKVYGAESNNYISFMFHCCYPKPCHIFYKSIYRCPWVVGFVLVTGNKFFQVNHS